MSIMERSHVAQLLRVYPVQRLEVEQLELGLQALTPVQRLVVEKLCIHPAVGNAERLCEILGCEKTTVYRHRTKALEQLAKIIT